MLRMPEFQYHHPQSPEEAVGLWGSLDAAMYVAGGTDLLPNLKHKLFNPGHLISLSKLPRGIRDAGDHWVIDAQVTLDTVAGHPDLPAVLTQAAGHVAGPQLRRIAPWAAT